MPSLAKTNPPNENEFEVSLFGPGIGESIVVHLGGGDWAIVDSCIDHETGNPVALDYLRSMQVPPDGVKLIVISHWHDDHSRGASVLLREYSKAKLVISSALKATEFRTLIGASLLEPKIGIGELRQCFDELQGPGRAGAEQRKMFAMADRRLFTSVHSEITSLSPSDRTLERSFLEISSLVQIGQQRRRAASHSENDVAVVLVVQFQGTLRVLLGSDLENTADVERGWQAIVRSTSRPTGKAAVFKVAHHGSRNADEPRVWSELLESDVYAILTPFRLGVKPLPSEEDQERLCSKTSNVFATCKTRSPKPNLNPTVNRIVNRVAKNIRRLDGRMGHLRLRSTGPADLRIDLFGAAYKVKPDNVSPNTDH